MLTAVLIAASIGLLVGGTGGALGMRAASNAQARVAEAQAQAVTEAAAAGPAGTEAALAPVRDQLRELGDMLDQMPAYCDGASEHYHEAACVAERVCTRAGISGDGVDAIGCEQALDQWKAERQVQVLLDAPEDQRAVITSIFQRRK